MKYKRDDIHSQSCRLETTSKNRSHADEMEDKDNNWLSRLI